jgi:hypothetical protein
VAGLTYTIANLPSLNTKAISPILGTTPDPLVKTIHYVDPLVLDLDGDGLEITPLATSILFDANGDAIKTATAWVGAGDGLLAWDRNANGSIDSGRELFGDETLLADGTKAAHGFAALAELDTGSVVNGVTVGVGDGVFDANDSAYSAVRVWTDVNQDGISQAAELHTLADSGVSAITLASAAPNTNYGDAVLVRSGTFTRADGSSGQAGSFILAQNNFVREFAPIAVSQAAQALPDVGGSGWVRDLQEAATQNPQLIDRVQAAANAQTRAGFKESVKALLEQWCGSSGYVSARNAALADGFGLIRVTNAGFAGNRPRQHPPELNSIDLHGHLCHIPAWNGHMKISNLKCCRARGACLLRPSAVRRCVAGEGPGAGQVNEDYWDRRLSKLTGVRVSGRMTSGRVARWISHGTA